MVTKPASDSVASLESLGPIRPPSKETKAHVRGLIHAHAIDADDERTLLAALALEAA